MNKINSLEIDFIDLYFVFESTKLNF